MQSPCVWFIAANIDFGFCARCGRSVFLHIEVNDDYYVALLAKEAGIKQNLDSIARLGEQGDLFEKPPDQLAHLWLSRWLNMSLPTVAYRWQADRSSPQTKQ